MTFPDLDSYATDPELVLFIDGNQVFVLSQLIAGFQALRSKLKGTIFLETVPLRIMDTQIDAGGVLAKRPPRRYLNSADIKATFTSYLEVITAQEAALSDELTAVLILGRRMASAVQLIPALGGGWDRSSLPERPECCGKLLHTSD